MSSEDLPFKPGDWVHDNTRVAKVKDVYACSSNGEVLLDLYIYNLDGDRLGRTSPALGGPKTYEPCCSAKNWIRIPRPSFPLKLAWISDPAKPGVKTMGYWFGNPLPPAKWAKPPKRPKAKLDSKWQDVPSFSREQLDHLVDLFTGANDPMSQSIAATADDLRRFIWGRHYPPREAVRPDKQRGGIE